MSVRAVILISPNLRILSNLSMVHRKNDHGLVGNSEKVRGSTGLHANLERNVINYLGGILRLKNNIESTCSTKLAYRIRFFRS